MLEKKWINNILGFSRDPVCVDMMKSVVGKFFVLS